jgi:GT2 family glycosyltransferase
MPRGRYEVIFADNGSSDGSVERVKGKFPSVKVVELGRNYGFAGGCNKASGYALGKYIAFLNIDTVVHRRWLSELVRVISEHRNVKACHSNILSPWTVEYSQMDREKMTKHVYFYDLSSFGYPKYIRAPFTDQPIRTLFVAGASFIVERELLEEIDYVFDDDFFAYCEDIDLALRINSLGYDTVAVPTSIVYHKNPLPMKASPNVETFRKVNKLLKNEFIAYFKSMNGIEFLLFLPLLLLGTPFKVRILGWSMAKQLVYGMASVPLALYSLIGATAEFPKYVEKRKKILRKKKVDKYWFLRELAKSADRGLRNKDKSRDSILRGH